MSARVWGALGAVTVCALGCTPRKAPSSAAATAATPATPATGEPDSETALGEQEPQEGDEPPEQGLGKAPPSGAAETALLAEVDGELGRMKSSSYSHHTHVDEAAGTFDYDCSGFLGYALSRSVPDALAAVQATTPRRPRSAEYVAFLQAIAPGAAAGRWQRLAHVRDLAPGDVIVWLKPPESRSKNTGHTMIVHGAPVADAAEPGAYVVPIADSTASPHGPGDARAATHRTGLGQAEIVLVTDSAGAPVGYRWSRGERSREKETTIMLARLR